MSTVQTAPPRPTARARPVMEVALLAFAVAAFALVFWLVRSPARVDHVDLVNGSATGLEVSVSSPDGGDELGLAEALPRRTTRVQDVVDQGDTWVFGVATASCPPVELRVSRARLEADGWRFVVPERVTAALAAGCAYQPPVG
ncbi:MAG: hypothetical protein U0W40_20265 [Acidimicrobiia bacterium]